MTTQSFTVLVTAQHLVSEAQKILQDAGGRIEFMADPIDEESLARRLFDGDIDAVLMRGSKPFTAGVLAAATGLKIIAKNGAGIESVDLEEAARRGIAVTVSAGANADAVAEHAIAMMLSLVRDLPKLDRTVRAGDWEGTAWQGRDFRASVVGILGYGSIGRSTARLAAALGAKVIVMDATRADADDFDMASDLDDFLRRVDILSLHCPLTEQTRGLIGKRELALMKAGSIIVNTARGPVIDEAALIESLRSGHLGGAGLDTFEIEPLQAGSPLRELANVILTPHVAGVTRQAALHVAINTATNIVEYLGGRALPPGNLVAGPGV
nr:hydroxyacid dehydrogenase [uncultured Cupriavidus sp.]